MRPMIGLAAVGLVDGGPEPTVVGYMDPDGDGANDRFRDADGDLCTRNRGHGRHTLGADDGAGGGMNLGQRLQQKLP